MANHFRTTPKQAINYRKVKTTEPHCPQCCNRVPAPEGKWGNGNPGMCKQIGLVPKKLNLVHEHHRCDRFNKVA